jgi:uncharacterized membrane protein
MDLTDRAARRLRQAPKRGPGTTHDNRNMTMKRITDNAMDGTRSALGAALPAMVIALLAASPASAQCRYEVEVIPIPPAPPLGSVAHPLAINDHGVVVGSYRRGVGFDKAFRWSPENGFELLEMPPGTRESVATDVNNNGIVVGILDITDDGYGNLGFVIDGEEFFLIDPPEGNWVEAEAVNEFGVATGFWAGDVAHAYIWADGLFTDLGSWMNGANTYPKDITDRLQIAGRYEGDDWPKEYAVLWQDGELTELGVIPDAVGSQPLGTNRFLDVAGQSTFVVGVAHELESRAFRWTPGEGLIDLGIFEGNEHAACIAVSETRQMIGRCWNGPAEGRSFVLHHDQMMDLQELLIPGSGISGLRIAALNAHGAIVGYGFNDEDDSTPFILHPVDSPEGDINTDCVVDVSDLLLLLAEWGRPDSPADINGDGIVNTLDLTLLLDQWT